MNNEKSERIISLHNNCQLTVGDSTSIDHPVAPLVLLRAPKRRMFETQM